jgi:hypothetical protein
MGGIGGMERVSVQENSIKTKVRRCKEADKNSETAKGNSKV